MLRWAVFQKSFILKIAQLTIIIWIKKFSSSEKYESASKFKTYFHCLVNKILLTPVVVNIFVS